MEEKACDLGGHLTTLAAASLIIRQMLVYAEQRWKETVSSDSSGLMNQTVPEAGFAFGVSSYVRQSSLFII